MAFPRICRSHLMLTYVSRKKKSSMPCYKKSLVRRIKKLFGFVSYSKFIPVLQNPEEIYPPRRTKHFRDSIRMHGGSQASAWAGSQEECVVPTGRRLPNCNKNAKQRILYSQKIRGAECLKSRHKNAEIPKASHDQCAA